MLAERQWPSSWSAIYMGQCRHMKSSPQISSSMKTHHYQHENTLLQVSGNPRNSGPWLTPSLTFKERDVSIMVLENSHSQIMMHRFYFGRKRALRHSHIFETSFCYLGLSINIDPWSRDSGVSRSCDAWGLVSSMPRFSSVWESRSSVGAVTCAD